jgi:hypothetical protein
LFDEIVVLYPRKGMRDCQSCKDNPQVVQLEIKLR